MKHLYIILALFSTIAIANAQSKNDPTYSRNNYKQPNKAIEAKELKNEGINNEAYIAEKDNASRNYKFSNNQNHESGAVILTPVIEKQVPALASARNYKSTFGKRNSVSVDTPNLSTPVVAEK